MTGPPDTSTAKASAPASAPIGGKQRKVGRRSLLAGAAGLALGGGITEAANLASRNQAPAALRLASPGEELMTEHGVLKRVLLAYRAAADQLLENHPPPVEAITDAAQIVSDYVESFHEGLEEAYVFPRVQARQPGLIRTLLIQHDRGRHLTASIRTAVAGDLGAAAARAALRRQLLSFVRMYEPHEAWEDTVVYPALRATSSPQLLAELAERFHDLENSRYGDDALRQVLDRVTGLEQQLGIDDLSAFTP